MGRMKYYGIKKAYPRIPIPRKLRGYIQLVRPFTLLPVIFAGFCVLLIGGFQKNLVYSGYLANQWVSVFHAIGTLVLIQIASNSLNQASDAEEDRINKPYRPIPRGLITPDEARTLAYVFFAFGIFRAGMIGVNFASFATLIVFLTIMYSSRPVRLKNLLGINNLVIGFTRGSLGFLACWSILYNPWEQFPLAVAVVLGIYCTFAWISKDFSDKKGDIAVGVKTFPNSTDEDLVLLLMAVGIGVAAISIVSFVAMGVFSCWVYGIAICLMVMAGIMLRCKETLIQQEKVLENIKLWKWANLGLMVIYLGLVISYAL